jgi:hypothetical protein
MVMTVSKPRFDFRVIVYPVAGPLVTPLPQLIELLFLVKFRGFKPKLGILELSERAILLVLIQCFHCAGSGFSRLAHILRRRRSHQQTPTFHQIVECYL